MLQYNYIKFIQISFRYLKKSPKTTHTDPLKYGKIKSYEKQIFFLDSNFL